MILRLEGEHDSITDAGSLEVNTCLEVHNGTLYRQPIMLVGLNWMMLLGSATVTGISTDFKGKTAMKPSKEESAEMLENITSIS